MVAISVLIFAIPTGFCTFPMFIVESVKLPVMLKSGTPGLRKLLVFPVTSSRLFS